MNEDWDESRHLLSIVAHLLAWHQITLLVSFLIHKTLLSRPSRHHNEFLYHIDARYSPKQPVFSNISVEFHYLDFVHTE